MRDTIQPPCLLPGQGVGQTRNLESQNFTPKAGGLWRLRDAAATPPRRRRDAAATPPRRHRAPFAGLVSNSSQTGRDRGWR